MPLRAEWRKPIPVLTFFLVLFTGVYVYVTAKLLHETSEAVDLTRHGLELTRRSVEATEAALKLTEESNTLTRESNRLTGAGLEESRKQADESNRLTAEGLAVSQEALKLTRTQAEIASRQSLREESIIQPAIQVRRYERQDDFGDRYDVAEFWNRGERLRSFGLRQWSFLQITRFNAEHEAEDVRFLPWWYFGPYEATRNDAGLLATLEATSSEYDTAESASKWRSTNAALESFSKTLESMTLDRGATIKVQPCVFFYMEYVDLGGRKHEKIVFLSSFYSPYDYRGYIELPDVDYLGLAELMGFFPMAWDRVPTLEDIHLYWDEMRDPASVFGPFAPDEFPSCYPQSLRVN